MLFEEKFFFMLLWTDFFLFNFTQLLARLFSKKMSRYCHSPGVVVGGGVVIVRRRAKPLTFCDIPLITEDIYLKLRIVVHYQKRNPYQ